VTKADPPTLTIHGDKDGPGAAPTIGADHGQAEISRRAVRLVIKPGAAHGWARWQDDMRTIADWFDKYLKNRRAGSLHTFGKQAMDSDGNSTNPTLSCHVARGIAAEPS